MTSTFGINTRPFPYFLPNIQEADTWLAYPPLPMTAHIRDA
jgi:hypothetical protein